MMRRLRHPPPLHHRLPLDNDDVKLQYVTNDERVPRIRTTKTRTVVRKERAIHFKTFQPLTYLTGLLVIILVASLLLIQSTCLNYRHHTISERVWEEDEKKVTITDSLSSTALYKTIVAANADKGLDNSRVVNSSRCVTWEAATNNKRVSLDVTGGGRRVNGGGGGRNNSRCGGETRNMRHTCWLCNTSPISHSQLPHHHHYHNYRQPLHYTTYQPL